MERDVELENMQETIEASDEEVAAKAKRSSKTFQRAKKGLVPAETREVFVKALEELRKERRAQLSTPFRTARTAG